MTDRRWKRNEREIASRLGGERVPITGRQRGDVPDVQHKWLSIECKSRQSIPSWLKIAIEQAVMAAKGSQLPIAILHEVGQRHGEDLVVMHLSDFEDFFGVTGEKELDNPDGEYGRRG
jgi:hypothetical protein